MTTKEPLQKVGRLAFRVEGKWWVAYYAEPETMNGALELARIQMTLIDDKKRKDQFIQLMRDVFSDMMEAAIGVRPQWPNPPEAAPEHERAGQA